MSFYQTDLRRQKGRFKVLSQRAPHLSLGSQVNPLERGKVVKGTCPDGSCHTGPIQAPVECTKSPPDWRPLQRAVTRDDNELVCLNSAAVSRANRRRHAAARDHNGSPFARREWG